MFTKLFVGGLPFTYSNDDLLKLFSAVGTVLSAKMVFDPAHGRTRGFGFVQMKTPQEAQAAMDQINGMPVGEKKVYVTEAKDKAPSKSDAPRTPFGSQRFDRPTRRNFGDAGPGRSNFQGRPGPRGGFDDRGPGRGGRKFMDRGPRGSFHGTPRPGAGEGPAFGADRPPRRFGSRPGGPRSFDRGPRSFDRGPRPPGRGPGSFDRGPQSFDRGPRPPGRGPGSFDRGPQSFDRGPRPPGRGPGSFDRGPRSFDRGPRPPGRGPRPSASGPGFGSDRPRRDGPSTGPSRSPFGGAKPGPRSDFRPKTKTGFWSKFDKKRKPTE